MEQAPTAVMYSGKEGVSLKAMVRSFLRAVLWLWDDRPFQMSSTYLSGMAAAPGEFTTRERKWWYLVSASCLSKGDWSLEAATVGLGRKVASRC